MAKLKSDKTIGLLIAAHLDGLDAIQARIYADISTVQLIDPENVNVEHLRDVAFAIHALVKHYNEMLKETELCLGEGEVEVDDGKV